MTGFTHRTRLGLAVPALASALLALAIGCGGEDGGKTATSGSADAAAEMPALEKGSRVVTAPDGAEAHIAVGELADRYPKDLPMPPDSEPQNSMFVAGKGGLATFISQASREELGSYFKKDFEGKGWTVDSAIEGDDLTTINASKGERKARVELVPRAGDTEVAITVLGS